MHNFTVRFYALGSTTYEARVDSNKIQQETFMSNGWNTKQISLPTGLLAPSQPFLAFNYTDGCKTRSYGASIFLDVKISGISLRVFITLSTYNFERSGIMKSAYKLQFLL